MKFSDSTITKFKKYFKLVFEDLCARDNGLTKASFGLYTFLKYANGISGYLARRLFNIMATPNDEL